MQMRNNWKHIRQFQGHPTSFISHCQKMWETVRMTSGLEGRVKGVQGLGVPQGRRGTQQ